jgi:hypothetical protein
VSSGRETGPGRFAQSMEKSVAHGIDTDAARTPSTRSHTDSMPVTSDALSTRKAVWPPTELTGTDRGRVNGVSTATVAGWGSPLCAEASAGAASRPRTTPVTAMRWRARVTARTRDPTDASAWSAARALRACTPAGRRRPRSGPGRPAVWGPVRRRRQGRPRRRGSARRGRRHGACETFDLRIGTRTGPLDQLRRPVGGVSKPLRLYRERHVRQQLRRPRQAARRRP